MWTTLLICSRSVSVFLIFAHIKFHIVLGVVLKKIWKANRTLLDTLCTNKKIYKFMNSLLLDSYQGFCQQSDRAFIYDYE
ncbi:MAG: hypothetical protein EBT78_15785 [Betaproteobacteria bacterium]|nr:hypothetical protein [Betaproteobacteria bacterium]NBT69212.1 hypothetical protein [Betaproteobacteria bacterium]